MTLVTDGLQRLFNNDNRPLAWLRNCGLGLVERSRRLKHLLARHALG
jgi:2-octaprenyl-6-methoxyphenol hydroxylase